MIGRFEVFTLALSEMTSSWNKIATEELKPYGLKGSCIVYLIALYKIPDGLTAANLCEMCNRDKAEVSRAIKLLEDKGFVVRKNTNPSGYRANITLTDNGKKITSELREKIKLLVEEGGRGLTEQERDIFYDALARISCNLKSIAQAENADSQSGLGNN